MCLTVMGKDIMVSITFGLPLKYFPKTMGDKHAFVIQ